jgi:membrane protein YqaA with SNARE-associated domain
MPLDPGASSAQKKGCFLMFIVLLADICLFTFLYMVLHGAALNLSTTILGAVTGGCIGYIMGYSK